MKTCFEWGSNPRGHTPIGKLDHVLKSNALTTRPSKRQWGKCFGLENRINESIVNENLHALLHILHSVAPVAQSVSARLL